MQGVRGVCILQLAAMLMNVPLCCVAATAYVNCRWVPAVHRPEGCAGGTGCVYIAAGTMWLLLLDCCCWGRVLLLVCRLCAGMPSVGRSGYAVECKDICDANGDDRLYYAALQLRQILNCR